MLNVECTQWDLCWCWVSFVFGSSTSADLSKMANFWQWKHAWLKVGHWKWFAGLAATPHSGNVGLRSTGTFVLEVSAG